VRTALILGLVALAPGLSPARAEARVRAEVDAARVGLEDQLQLSVVVEGDEDVTGAPVLPVLKGLRLAGGPMASQQFSFVNGRSSQSRTFTWVLQPLAVGKAEVPPVRVPLASGEKSTQPVVVDVVAGSVKPRARPQARDPFEDDPFAPFFGREQRRPAREPKLYVELAASRDKLRVGEPLLLTYYVYTQVAVTDLSFKDAPQYPGFWARDLEQPKGPLRTERVVVEGEEYQRAAIVQKLLFPTRAGALSSAGRRPSRSRPRRCPARPASRAPWAASRVAPASTRARWRWARPPPCASSSRARATSSGSSRGPR
jgi:hypothetical protein